MNAVRFPTVGWDLAAEHGPGKVQRREGIEIGRAMRGQPEVERRILAGLWAMGGKQAVAQFRQSAGIVEHRRGGRGKLPGTNEMMVENRPRFAAKSQTAQTLPTSVTTSLRNKAATG